MKREKFNKQKVVMRTRKKLNEEIDIMRTITKKKNWNHQSREKL